VKNTNEFQTKSKKERIIPMSAKIKEILLERKFNILPDRTNKYVFAKPGDIKYSEEFISKRFKKCVKMVNVNPEYHFHNLRSSFACDLIKKGVSIFVVQKLLGHSSVSTTERNYAHLQTEALKQAISLI
jgi:site-specific recombinase XerD